MKEFYKVCRNFRMRYLRWICSVSEGFGESLSVVF